MNCSIKKQRKSRTGVTCCGANHHPTIVRLGKSFGSIGPRVPLETWSGRGPMGPGTCQVWQGRGSITQVRLELGDELVFGGSACNTFYRCSVLEQDQSRKTHDLECMVVFVFASASSLPTLSFAVHTVGRCHARWGRWLCKATTGLTASTSYSYRVRAYNGAGDSDYSNTASATTPELRRCPPRLQPGRTAASTSRINLTWMDNATNETGFQIERCKGSTCTNFGADCHGGRGTWPRTRTPG